MATKLKSREANGVKEVEQEGRLLKERAKLSLGRAPVAIDEIERVRLTWYAPFLARLMKTLNSENPDEYKFSVITQRYIQMARQRVGAKNRIRTVTNPHTSSVFVWVERRK